MGDMGRWKGNGREAAVQRSIPESEIRPIWNEYKKEFQSFSNKILPKAFQKLIHLGILQNDLPTGSGHLPTVVIKEA